MLYIFNWYRNRDSAMYRLIESTCAVAKPFGSEFPKDNSFFILLEITIWFYQKWNFLRLRYKHKLLLTEYFSIIEYSPNCA